MAFFQVNMFSPTLGFPVDVNVFIPTPDSNEIINHKDISYFSEGAQFPVLYLLHGAYGNYSDWYRMTGIERYAMIHKLAVIMPPASNSFYQDMFRGGAYLSFLSEELPRFMEQYFPISRERENTFAAGLSMGGYGALKIALARPDRFCACASLSGPLDIAGMYEYTRDGSFFRWEDIVQDPEHLAGSNADLLEMIRRLQEKGVALPRIYMTVGTEDFLYQANLHMKEELEQMGADLTFAEHSGVHGWDFWDAHIQDVLRWLNI